MKELEMGGPAFPIPLNPGEDYEFHGPTDGMYLRDWFAGLAMQGLLAAQIYGFNDRPAKGPFASMAYEMADAMLKTRANLYTKEQK